MNREHDPTQDNQDEFYDETLERKRDISSRQPRPRSSQHDPERRERQERQGKQLPPARRHFTPARNTGGYQDQRSHQPRRPLPGQQRPANPPFEPRDPQAEDSEYEQFLRYQRYQRAQQNRQGQAIQRQARDPRAEDDEYERFLRYQRRRQSAQQPERASTPTAPAPRKPRPRRRAWSTLLIGCIGGIVTIAIIVAIIAIVIFRVLPNSIPGFNIGTSTYTDKQQTLSLPITSTITQLSIQNSVGAITVNTDPNATTGILTYIKKTQATSQSNASAEFGRITVTALPGNSTGCPSATCLAITTTIPDATNDDVDMQITLPPQNPSPTFMLSSTSQKGNVTVQNFSGLLALTDDTGNISVKGGLLAAGSCLQSRMGNVTFMGTLETTIPPTINPCTGSPVGPSGASTDQPWYSMKTGTGAIDASFNMLSTNIKLDATISNQGKISSDFNLSIKQNADGSSSYFGPLLPNMQPIALLTLTVDVSGDIILHKA